MFPAEKFLLQGVIVAAGSRFLGDYSVQIAESDRALMGEDSACGDHHVAGRPYQCAQCERKWNGANLRTRGRHLTTFRTSPHDENDENTPSTPTSTTENGTGVEAARTPPSRTTLAHLRSQHRTMTQHLRFRHRTMTQHSRITAGASPVPTPQLSDDTAQVSMAA
eukprot:Polyplicarium_translucidae@DN3076_c0_g2_i2.p1